MDDWWSYAACADMDTEIWYPSPRDGNGTAAQAIAICRACPVQQECLDDALRSERNLGYGHTYGIRGGLGVVARLRLTGQTTPRYKLPDTCHKGHMWPDQPFTVDTIKGPKRVCLECKPLNEATDSDHATPPKTGHATPAQSKSPPESG